MCKACGGTCTKSKIGMARKNKKLQGSLMKVAGVGGGFFVGSIVRENLTKVEAGVAEEDQSFLAKNPIVVNGLMLVGGAYFGIQQKGIVQDMSIGLAGAGALGIIEEVIAKVNVNGIGRIAPPKNLAVGRPGMGSPSRRRAGMPQHMPPQVNYK